MKIRIAEFENDEDAIRNIRREVFIVEQDVPADLEWDGRDAGCVHAIAEDDDGTAIGTGRLLPDGHIGRMAVRKSWRGSGAGAALLECLVNAARGRGLTQVELNAQTHAEAFYRRHGFVASGKVFEEAGIPHVRMTRSLPEDESNG